jgi:hypothetical protein
MKALRSTMSLQGILGFIEIFQQKDAATWSLNRIIIISSSLEIIITISLKSKILRI